MALFFDAAWFDARLAERGLDRGALAAAAGIAQGELHRLFTNERTPNGRELSAFAALIGADLVEVSLRCGVAAREADASADPAQRIESIEARLDEIEAWLAEQEARRKSA